MLVSYMKYDSATQNITPYDQKNIRPKLTLRLKKQKNIRPSSTVVRIEFLHIVNFNALIEKGKLSSSLIAYLNYYLH